MIVSVFTISVILPNAFADGLTQENLPPASVGDRDASLLSKSALQFLQKIQLVILIWN